MNRLIVSSIAAAIMAIPTVGVIAQTTPTPSPSSAPRTAPPATTAPENRSDAMPGSTGMSGTTTAAPGASGSAVNNSYSGMRDSKAWERTHRVSKIIGTDVVNTKGEKIGDVEDIVLDSKGNVAYAVISTGGFLGMGDKMHAVPWSAIRTNTGKDDFVLNIDRERLRTAPGFDKSNWPNVNDAKWSAENNRYFPSSGASPSSTSPAGNK